MLEQLQTLCQLRLCVCTVFLSGTLNQDPYIMSLCVCSFSVLMIASYLWLQLFVVTGASDDDLAVTQFQVTGSTFAPEGDL